VPNPDVDPSLNPSLNPSMNASMNPTDDALRALLTHAHTIAVVGASNKPERSSNGIMKRLLALGYRVVPVTPNETEVLGEKAYASVRDVPFPIDVVDVFRRSDAVVPIAHDAVAAGAKTLWLQQGVINEEAAAIARAAGLTVVMDSCIAVVHSMLRVPKK
jgi:predicted CoA-binding protein